MNFDAAQHAQRVAFSHMRSRTPLGGSPYRGIGAGLDEGDLVNLGIVLPSGFEPAESILGIDPTEN